jgi:cell division septation protein DedD
MIELEKHIEVLLLNNDCVIVPGLGGFMGHYMDARYDEQDSLFLPPLRTLGFNPQLTINDSLLVQSYVEAYDISYPEALRRIEAEVQELHQHLETEGQYELNDIGILSLNDEGNITFEPCEAGILTPTLYGLGSFEMQRLAPAPSVNAENDNSIINESAITIKMSWIRNMVAAAAAIIAFLMIGTPISNSEVSTDIQQSAFLAIPTPHQEKSNIKAEEVTNATISESESTKEETKVAVEVQTKENEPRYCLVLASQVSKKNAENFVNQLQANGLKEARVLETTMTRVVYGDFASESDAYNQLQSLQCQSKIFSEAWVMKVKP